MSNKYPGRCPGCQQSVPAYTGKLEKVARKWVVWCNACFDKSDNSSYEDRQCGNRAYEDSCAEQCGY